MHMKLLHIAAAQQHYFVSPRMTTDLGFERCERVGRLPMAVLDHDHQISAHDGHSAGGAGQFCLFWVGVFAVIALLGFLFKG
jgi:hypothetical protein